MTERSLPVYSPIPRWELAPKGYKATGYGSIFPAVVKLADGRLIVDQALCKPRAGLRLLAWRLAYAASVALARASWWRLHRLVWRLGRLTWQWEVKVFENRDHPNIGLLPSNAPRIVKRMFKREYQLRLIRATDAAPLMAESRAAEAAWNEYQKAAA